jgi:hypothetical protein
MTNPIPRIAADGTIRCMNHPDLIAIALQAACAPAWSDAILSARSHTPLLRVAPVEDFEVPFARVNPHAIFWAKVENYYRGNSALGMCEDCAQNFWSAFGFAPLYINQHAIFSSHVTITRTTIDVDFEPHTFSLMRIETPQGISNKVELVCPECVERRYPVPYPLKLTTYQYE